MEKDKDENIVSRTEEVRDIIEKIPDRTGRIVAIIVVSLCGLLLFFGWKIEYPEKVSGPVLITSQQAPIKLVANSSGKLHILKSNSDVLSENEIFAFIENPAKLEDVLIIEKSLEKLTPDELYANPSCLSYSSSLSLGDLSMFYYSFLNSIEKVSQYKTGKPYEKKLENIASLLKSQLKLRVNNEKQIKTRASTVKIAEKSIQRDSTLFRSLTIAEIDIDRSSAEYLKLLESSQTLEKDNTSIGMQIDDTRYKLQEILLEQKESEANLKIDLFSSYNELCASIRKWKITYCFTSPINGNLEYLNFWRENDFIAAGTGAFSVLPTNNPILGQVYLPAAGAGKVSVGQEVIIKLDNYPYIEYGSINGKVQKISRLSNPTSEFTGQSKINTYLITVDLPSSLTTNYGANLDFTYEIKGMADILIKKRKLLERLFDNLKYIVSNK